LGQRGNIIHGVSATSCQVEDLTTELSKSKASIAEGTQQRDELTVKQDQLADALETRTAELADKVAEITHLEVHP
jgi:hypothetical protein